MLVGWFGEVFRDQVTSEQRPKEVEECDTWRPGRKPGAEERAGTEVLRQRPQGCSEGAGGRLRLEACERSGRERWELELESHLEGGMQITEDLMEDLGMFLPEMGAADGC